MIKGNETRKAVERLADMAAELITENTNGSVDVVSPNLDIVFNPFAEKGDRLFDKHFTSLDSIPACDLKNGFFLQATYPVTPLHQCEIVAAWLDGEKFHLPADIGKLMLENCVLGLVPHMPDDRFFLVDTDPAVSDMMKTQMHSIRENGCLIYKDPETHKPFNDEEMKAIMADIFRKCMEVDEDMRVEIGDDDGLVDAWHNAEAGSEAINIGLSFTQNYGDGDVRVMYSWRHDQEAIFAHHCLAANFQDLEIPEEAIVKAIKDRDADEKIYKMILAGIDARENHAPVNGPAVG